VPGDQPKDLRVERSDLRRSVFRLSVIALVSLISALTVAPMPASASPPGSTADHLDRRQRPVPPFATEAASRP
jgi:hypothetical protein